MRIIFCFRSMLTIITYVLTADAEKTTCFCSRKTIINAEWWNITVDGTARVLDCNQFQSLFISVARNGHDMAVCDSGQLVSKTGNESYFYNSFKPATFKMDTFQFITLKVQKYIYKAERLFWRSVICETTCQISSESVKTPLFWNS